MGYRGGVVGGVSKGVDYGAQTRQDRVGSIIPVEEFGREAGAA